MGLGDLALEAARPQGQLIVAGLEEVGVEAAAMLDRAQGMGFAMNMLNKIDALRSHLYSIQLKAEKVAKGECDKEMEHAA